MEMKCLVVLLQISWVFAQGGRNDGVDDFGGFSLIQSDFPVDGAGASNETSNDTSTDPLVPKAAGGDQHLLLNSGGDQADQPQPEAPVPTRLPVPAAGVTTPAPPLVRPEGNSTTNATTAAPTAAPTESPKSKGEGGGSADYMGNLALVLGGACVLHLLY